MDVTRKRECQILRATSKTDELRVHVAGTNSRIGGYIFHRTDSYWAYRVQNFEITCSGREEHVLDVLAMKIAEIIGVHTDGVPHTLVTSCPCKICGKSIRTAWGLEYRPEIPVSTLGVALSFAD